MNCNFLMCFSINFVVLELFIIFDEFCCCIGYKFSYVCQMICEGCLFICKKEGVNSFVEVNMFVLIMEVV